MPTMKGETFTNIQEPLSDKLHTGIQFQNDFQAEGSAGNQGSPAEEETGAGKSYKGEVERAGFEDQDPTVGSAMRGEKSSTKEPGNYEN
jgi:hypothetical protein